jgi:menaquinone-dependent protoporphyrinogen IX oxidase
MKVLVVYYSRTGTTKKVGENIAFWLKARREEIIDGKDRKGPIGYIKAGRDASAKKFTKISKAEWDPREFNMIIIGTPIWAWTIAPAIRTYIEQHKDVLKDKELGFFCTMGSNGDKNAFKVMETLIGRKPKATLSLKTRDVVQSNYETAIREFVKKL